AFAALSALESLPSPQSRFVYTGPVVSGATIGTWRHEPMDIAGKERSVQWIIASWDERLSYRPDLPSLTGTQQDLERWQREAAIAARAGDAKQARDCHARVEQAARQLWRLSALPPDGFPLRITLARLGEAIWLFVAGEHYQGLQTSLR